MRKKKERTPEQKARRKKIWQRILVIALAAFCVFVIIVLSGNADAKNKIIKTSRSFEKVKYEKQLVPILDEDGHYVFNTDKPLKVMQLTDIHMGGGIFSMIEDKKALNAMAAMIAYEKPDLVIATGDVAYSVIFRCGTNDNRIPARAFAELMETLGVYWTVTFGNHDAERNNKYKKDALINIYNDEKYSHCLFQKGPENIAGDGNSVIKVKNSAGLVERVLVMLDSHMYQPNDKFGLALQYDNIKDNQCDWYTQEIAKINNKNKEVRNAMSPVLKEKYGAAYENVPSSLYFHIPLKEYKEALVELKNNKMKDTENVKYFYGRIGEIGKEVYHGVGKDKVFATMEKVGGDSVFVGHDHFNNLSVTYNKTKGAKPIRLTYGVSLDYFGYTGIALKGSQRGCTIITYSGQDITIVPENFYQDKYVTKYKKDKARVKEHLVPKV